MGTICIVQGWVLVRVCLLSVFSVSLFFAAWRVFG